MKSSKEMWMKTMVGRCGFPHGVKVLGLLLLLDGSRVPLLAQESGAQEQPAKEQPAKQESGAPMQLEQGNITLPKTVEDWSVLTLDKSELKMLVPPTPGEIDKMEKYTRERWQVIWRERDPIDLYIVKPAGVENPPVIVYLYSWETASKRLFMDDGWCQRATSGGFAAIGFVPAMTEDRFEHRPMKEWFISELQESLGSTTHDVQMVLNYLDSRKDVDVTRVGIFGIGSGATVGILAAAADPRIKVLEIIDPWGDWPNWLAATPLIQPVERRNFITPEFLAKAAPLDPVKWLPKLTSQQVRLEFVDESALGRQELTTAMANVGKAAPKNVEVVHFATGKDLKSSIVKTGGSFQWVKGELTPPTPLLPSGSAETAKDAAIAKP